MSPNSFICIRSGNVLSRISLNNLPLPLFFKEGFKNSEKSSPFEKGIEVLLFKNKLAFRKFRFFKLRWSAISASLETVPLFKKREVRGDFPTRSENKLLKQLPPRIRSRLVSNTRHGGDLARLFILSQPHKCSVPKMAVGCPFSELDLSD